MSETERLPECVCVGCTRPGTECGGLLCKKHAAPTILPDDPVYRLVDPTIVPSAVALMKERDDLRAENVRLRAAAEKVFLEVERGLEGALVVDGRTKTVARLRRDFERRALGSETTEGEMKT